MHRINIRKKHLHQIIHTLITTAIPLRTNISVLLLQILLCVSAQAQFVNVAADLNITSDGIAPMYGSGVSFYDYDKDGWDDITLATKNAPIKVYRNVLGQAFELALTFPNDSDVKHPIWVDYDNDGDADFFYSRDMGSCILYRNDGNDQFVNVTANLNLPSSIARSFGCSWGDYDNDGFLDIYVCNYQQGGNITNWLFHNNTDGTFTELAAAVGVDNGIATTFASVWFDYDSDGDSDLLCVNDRELSVGLYRNDGGSFVDVTDATGLNVPINGMCASIRDYDNDLDLDIYITNTEEGNLLFRNNEGIFTDEIASSNMACYSVCWGALWLDYDNNMQSDLYVTSISGVNNNQNYFFTGTGTTFQLSTSLGFQSDLLSSYSVAGGDFDNNGHTDMLVSNVEPISISLWKNNSTANNYIKLGLTGTISNADAVGAILQWSTGGSSFIAQSVCGDNYLSQNSQYQILGMGQSMSLDSLVIHWPSGWVDTFYDLPANHFYPLIEGETMGSTMDVQIVQMCANTAVEMDAGVFESYAWNTGEVSRFIVVSTSGSYPCVVTNSFGLSTTVNFEVSEFDQPQIDAMIQSPSCAGDSNGSIQISLSEGMTEDVFWNGVEGMSLLENISAGLYEYSFSDDNECIIQGEIVVESPQVLLANVVDTPACVDATGEATLLITGGEPPYAVDWMNEDPFALLPGDHNVQVTDGNGCMVSLAFEIELFPEMNVTHDLQHACYNSTGSVQLNISSNSSPYSIYWNGANPEVLTAGDYIVVITDANGCEANYAFAVLSNSELIYESEIINAANETGGSIQLIVKGGTPPYTFQWNTGDTTSFIDELAAGQYTCTITDQFNCTIHADIALINLNVNENIDVHNVFPNPFTEKICIQSSEPFSYWIFDALGRVVNSNSVKNIYIEIPSPDFLPGVYFVKVNERVYHLVK